MPAYPGCGDAASPRRSSELTEGYRVETTAGRIGTVERVLRRRPTGEPYALVVRAGLFVPRLVVVPVSSVRAVDLSRRCVELEPGVLETPPVQPSETEAVDATEPDRAREPVVAA